MSIRTVYADGRFDVFNDERHVIHQPFKPSAEGIQEPWNSEEEALAWWDTQKAAYTATTEEE
jgi:hypothetical protein